MRKHRSLVLVLMMIVLCATIIVGSTMAYYTDEVPAGENLVTSGDLEVNFEWADKKNGSWQDAASSGPIFNQTHWEPNFTTVKYIRVSNTGDMPFQYELNVVPTLVPEEGVNLMDVIDVYFGVVDENTPAITAANYAAELQKVGNLTALLKNENGAGYGIVLPEDAKGTLPQGVTAYNESVTVCIALHMQHTAGNEYMNRSVGEGFNVQLAATQYTYDDAFGTLFSGGAQLPEVEYATSKTISVTPDENGLVPYDIVFESETGVMAVVPKGAKMEQGANQLILIVYPKAKSDANLSLQANEVVSAWEVKVEGLADDNAVPVRFTLPEAMQKGLNIGNYSLYHVENGISVPMTRVEEITAASAHNSFTYNPATGDMGLALATFSEVAVVSDTENGWNGEFDYTWYNADATELTIANADQLAAFGAIVGGMNGQTQDSFADKTVKLISDINLGDKESGNNPDVIFYPIGYYNSTGSYEKVSGGSVTSNVSSFEGIFDGNGHTISNFYQNTWEMFGDYNDGYSGTPNHYKDAMGLFGYVANGTVKNLTVDHFSSDGEFTPTGVIAAYAVNSTFENIAITNCNPRVYNTGNGGIVGIGGNSDDPDTYKLTFTNITIDNTNTISALWGSWDVACGGLVGMFRGAGHVYMTNCHVAAQMDVNNDVCGNYQYYWYRYSGMMVGTNKNMITDKDGYTVPETDKFHAENCTVHFGDWNDYYYCELVANSLASYTHDHQFSRLEQIEKLDEIKSGDTWTMAGNFLLISGDTKTCYHIVDNNGTLTQHLHTDAGYEDGIDEDRDGNNDLKEDKQIVFLPFNQLFTGYGYGVKHIPVYNGKDYAFEGITILDREVADSTEKFAAIENCVTEYNDGDTINIGDMFKAASIQDEKLHIKHDKVQVFVSPVGEDSTAGGIYTASTVSKDDGAIDWTKGTLTFSGKGAATITITDYYFCTPTTINVNIKDKEAAEKFETKFTGDFLYRVGNQNTVKLDSLFKAKDGVTVGTVSVTVDTVDGTSASGTYTPNATWANGTIQFSGTGVVKVTIKDDDTYCTPTVLYLEVVDATNITSATGTTTGGNFVLLCDVNTSNYVNYWNCTLYGNGFTYSLNGAPTAYNSKQGKGVIITKNSTLDNLVIVGDVYTAYGAYTEQDYYNTAIDVTGDTIIRNCYISGCAAPVRARNNVTIKDTTLYGGAVGNLIIESGTATLENVTTANYDDGRALVGMGIVIHPDATEAAKLVLNGTLTQYNFISESKAPTDTSAKNIHSAMFGNSFSKYHFGTSPNRYVNTGIISMKNSFNGDDITDNAQTGYSGSAANFNGENGYVYTRLNTSGSVNNNFPEYKPTTQGAVPPSYSFDYTTKNYVDKTDGSNDYCYEENGKVNISMDEGDTFNWDTSILTIGKGIADYTVTMNGTDYTGKSIAFNTAGDYKVTYTYNDVNNYSLDENGDITTYSVTYTKTVDIVVAVVKATTKHAEFTFGSSNTASTTVTVGNNTYVMPDVSATSSTIGSTTVSGQTIYYPIVEIIMSDGMKSHTSGWYAYFPVFSGAVTITDYANNGTGDKMTPYNGSTTTMPSGLFVVGDAKTLFKYQSGSNAGEQPVVKNNMLVYSSAKIEANRNEYNTVIQYSYQDNAGSTYYYYIGYHAPAQTYSNGCVTPDTLVTLADGSKKEIQDVTYEDQLLVWDFYKGEYTDVPVALIVNHGLDRYTVIELMFEDGTIVKAITAHSFFDADENKFVLIDSANAEQFVGHRFVKRSGDSTETVKLAGVKVYEQETESYTLVSAVHYNFITEDMFSLTNAFHQMQEGLVIGEGMKYDEARLNEDVAAFGLYTYDAYADYITEEQFIAFGGPHLKISVEKGYTTYEYTIDLIEEYLK